MSYLLDTDTLIYWLKGNSNVEQNVLRVGLSEVSTSVITLSELYYGAYKSKKQRENLQAVERVRSKHTIIEFADEASKIFGETKAELERKGVRLQDADIMIAAIALQNNLTLVTNNVNHFKRIKNLRLENWI